ncbi:PKD domain-containing protein [Aporhodopirellula aestuarii]|uniref:VWA domain-containing protein n=1 Tax=Aporhodopirellula aestuarii TaxID=2950107 RepID=A0ABT0UC23_9BACT|nr:PKD domain-containing protein [Aporhodopirellula aestuarii]MCM2374569.1 VWA domain-containing protein [Aporhodopirellula aestuarii]
MIRHCHQTVRKQLIVVVLICAMLTFALPIFAAEPTHAPMTFVVVIDISGSMDDDLPSPIQPILSDKTKIANVRRKVSRLSKDLPDGTRVIAIVFDHASTTLCDVKLLGSESRMQLQEAVEKIKSSGGTTFLWRAADDALALARKLATENPENRVRMLLLSDGGDEEKAPGLDHNSLVRKYSDLLQEVVTLDWVTIGWDLAADVKQVLEKERINVIRVDEAVDLVPLSAGFELSATSIRVGEEIGLLDTSYGEGIVLQAADWGDGTPYSKGDVLRHRYDHPGEFAIRYVVKSDAGRESRVTKTIRVVAPDAPIAKIATNPAVVTLGDPVVLTDVSEGEVADRRWILPGGVVKSDSEVTHRFEDIGAQVVSLVVKDKLNQRSEAKATVLVRQPPAPTTSIKLSAATAKPGDRVTAIKETTGGVRQRWLLPDGSESDEQHVTFVVPKEYGEQIVGLTVWDKFDQTVTSEAKLNVPRPGKPVANLLMPKRIGPGTPFQIVDQSEGVIESSQLFIDGRPVNDGRIVDFVASEQGGRHVVRKVVAGPGGTATFEQEIEVDAHAKPVAGFTIGTRRPTLGDSVLITSTAHGPIESMVFHVTGFESPISIDLAADEASPFFEFPCSATGEVSIRQVVTGPGGTDEMEQHFEVVPKAVQPTALFEANRLTGRGPTEVEFDNQSTGSVERTIYDFGDSSEPRVLDFDADAKHTFAPGKWNVIVTVYGPEGTSPRTWEETIEIAEPLAEWVRNLSWQFPIGMILIGGGVWFVAKRNEANFAKSLDMIGGALVVTPVSNIYESKTFAFDGEHADEAIKWDESTSVLVSMLEVEAGAERFCITLQRDGFPDESAIAESGETLTLGDFTIIYTA